jgi:hypothetical protein
MKGYAKMKRKTWLIVAGVLTALLLVGAVGAVAVYAQNPTPPVPGIGQGGPGGPGRFGDGSHPLAQSELAAAAKTLGIPAEDLSAQLKSDKTLEDIASAQGVDIEAVREAIQAARPVMLGSTELAAAAKALGITSDDLSTQLKSGKTLANLAAAKGVTLQVVQDAIQAARKAELTAQISQAVTDGRLTQDKADWILEGLNKGYLDGPGGFGFGLGLGPGGPPMDRGQRSPQPTPSTTP